MNFEQAFDRVVGHEGGYVDNPADPGGRTNYGISQRAYPDEDIAGMTLARARELYRRDYWDRCECESLPAALRFAVFDLAVNAGPRAAIQDLQLALCVDHDGVIGPQTRGAIATLSDPLDVMRAAVRVHAAGLERRANAQGWPAFGRGWARRVVANLLEL